MKKKHSDTLAPIEAYCEAIAQKNALSAVFIQKLSRYAQSRNGALAHQISRLQADGSTRDQAIRQSYRELLLKKGRVQVKAASPDFRKNLNLFFKEYIRNFPIPEEQMSKADFRDVLKAGKGTDGYQEVMFMLRCPITRKIMAGWEGTIQPATNSATIWYAFIHPRARGMGLLQDMVAMVREIIEKAVLDHCASGGKCRYHGKPTILIECNDISRMSLERILLDSTGVDSKAPPCRGDDLTASAVEQHARDGAWKRVGARSLGDKHGQCVVYYQPDLMQITHIHKSQAPLVERHLAHDAALDKKGHKKAARLLKLAIGKSAGGIQLDLRALAYPKQTHLNARQVLDTMRAGYVYSSFIYDKRAKQWMRNNPLALARRDIYFRTLSMSVKKTARNGKLRLLPVKPYGPEGMELDFRQAGRIVKQVIRQIPSWKDQRLQRSYGDLLKEMSIQVVPQSDPCDAFNPAFR